MEAFIQITVIVLIITAALYALIRRARPSQIPDEPVPPELEEPKPVKPKPTSTFEELLRRLQGGSEEKEPPPPPPKPKPRRKPQKTTEQKLADLEAKIHRMEVRQQQYEEEMEKVQGRTINWKKKLQNPASARDAIIAAEILKRKF